MHKGLMGQAMKRGLGDDSRSNAEEDAPRKHSDAESSSSDEPRSK